MSFTTFPNEILNSKKRSHTVSRKSEASQILQSIDVGDFQPLLKFVKKKARKSHHKKALTFSISR